MAKPVDLELKKAFLELQVKMVETRKKIYEIDGEIETFKFVGKQICVNLCVLEEIPEDTNTYEAVGRIFLLTDTESLKKKYAARENEIMLRVDDLKDKKIYLDKNLKESENNIREMVQVRKEQAEPKA